MPPPSIIDEITYSTLKRIFQIREIKENLCKVYWMALESQ